MSFGKEIKNKMASINNTQKITKAMEMISISKFRKIQIKLNMFQPYCQIIKRILSQIIYKNIEYKYICTEPEKFEQVGIIVISTDKGLCGSLNSNLFKKVSKKNQKIPKQKY
ncbi:F0F1 ATP synthase subunit gamma [Buchnera aphidicola (Hormaphis cornu)]|nr:F0F1 ATP synthase subunit gamma [Buchnera aphidicola (Hormaphis cornu)]